jgi:ATP-binding cassette subfamily B protein
VLALYTAADLLTGPGSPQVRERFSYVEQEAPVLPGTVRENVLFSNPDATTGELHDVLDEATSQVDGRSETAIHKAIRAASKNGAVITVAHRLSTVVDADTIILMENSTIRAADTHAALIESDELYRELVTSLRINDGK